MELVLSIERMTKMLYSNDLSQIALVSPAAAAFLAENDLETIELGRHDLPGEDYVNVMEYTPGAREERNYEAHRDYIDIQMVVSGVEAIEIAPLERCVETKEYDTNDDYALYSNATDGEQFALVPGRFIAAYPEDAHMPGIALLEEETPIRKAVFKIRV